MLSSSLQQSDLDKIWPQQYVNHELPEQAEIKIARRNINNLRYADDTTLTAESEEELKSLLVKVKEDI